MRPSLQADVGLDTPHPIEDQGVGESPLSTAPAGAVVVPGPLPSDHLAAAELHLLA